MKRYTFISALVTALGFCEEPDGSVTNFFKGQYDIGKCLKPVFSQIAETHIITRSQLILLLAGSVQTKLKIN